MVVKWFNRLAFGYFVLGMALAWYAGNDVTNLVSLWQTDLDYPLANLLTLLAR